MLKKIPVNLFWLLFFGFFFFMITPKLNYLKDGLPVYMGKNSLFDRSIFGLHIFSGVIVYFTGVLQFTPFIRNKNISLHRKLGKLYITASLLCILALYFMIPDGLCAACRPSHYVVTTLWFVFVIFAFYFIKQKKVVLHQRMMIRGFICASYFVSVRLIDHYGMGLFRALFKDESNQLLVSDICAWLVPLLFFQVYWMIKGRKSQSIYSSANMQQS